MKTALRKIINVAAVISAAVVLLTALASCGPKYEESLVISSAAELVEASYEINTIFFGKGLPTKEKADDDVLPHYELADDSPYRTEDEIKAAALAVYSPEYCSFLFEKGFTGLEVSFGNDEITEPEIIDARYVEYNGRLVMLPVDKADILPLNRTYDTKNVKIVSQKGKKVTVSLPSFVDGVPSEDVELTLVMTDDGFRLDSPTY